MKTVNLFIFALVGLFCFNLHAQDKYLVSDQAPEAIKAYVSKHFPNHKIIKYKKEAKFNRVEYEVKLNGDIELEFDTKMAIKEIESHKELPKSVIPNKIGQYIANNYPKMVITEWKKKRRGQKVELNDDLEVYFDMKGNFLREDD